jgi:hypothetical protein
MGMGFVFKAKPDALQVHLALIKLYNSAKKN